MKMPTKTMAGMAPIQSGSTSKGIHRPDAIAIGMHARGAMPELIEDGVEGA